MIVLVAGFGTGGALARAARRSDTVEHVRRLRGARGWRLPERPRRWLRRVLQQADLGIEPEPALETVGIGVASALVVGLSLAPAAVPVMAVGALVAGPIVVFTRRARGDQRFTAELLGALDHVALDLRSGSTVRDAVRRLSEGSGPVAEDLRKVQVRADLGLDWPRALAAWPSERPTDEVRAVAGSLALASTLGGQASTALEGLATSLRQRLDVRAEARALSAQARMSALVVGAAPLGYLAMAGLVDPGAVTPLVATSIGRFCLGAGILLELLAAWWMHRIVELAVV